MTSLNYGEMGWKSGYLRDVGQDAILYDPNEIYELEVPYEIPTTIKNFNMYLVLGSSKKGGSDEKFNDCLYDSLKYFIFNLNDYYKSAADLKIQLGLGRYDKIPLSSVYEIEEKINKKEPFQINIRGDFIRSSIIPTNKQANISLYNEHYEPEKIERNLTPFVRFQEKKIILYSKKDFEAYNGVKKWTMSKEEYNKIFYDFNNEYIIFVRHDYRGLTMNIEDEYNYIIEVANDLKIESKGLINLYKSGSYLNACLSLFDYVTKHIVGDPILQDEAEWIKACSCGSLISSESCTETKLYKYDVKSLFPSIYKSSNFKFPVKRGEFMTITEFSNYIDFGIYRAIVQPSEDIQYNKLFRFNKMNYYSVVDLQNAKSLGFKIELIQDDKPNFLKYSSDKLMKFSEIFSKYNDILYPLKEKNVKQSKFLLNLLWGALSSIDKKKQYITDSFKLGKNESIFEIVQSRINENEHRIKTTNNNAFYRTNFARLCPFIIGNGRKLMSQFMKPHYKNIRRVLTDSIELTEPIHFKTKVEIGELKYEGCAENCEIKNCASKIIYKL